MISTEKMATYPLDIQLAVTILEDFHGDYHEADPAKVAGYLKAIFRREIHKCYYCDHVGIFVNRYAHYHVGGKGEVSDRCCDNADDCIKRVKLDKSRDSYQDKEGA